VGYPGDHPPDPGGAAGGHDISFYCDDIEGTVKDLKSRGVPFTGDVEDHGYGLVTHFTAPGGVTVQLYQPRYQKGGSRPAKKKKKKATKKAPAKKASSSKESPKKRSKAASKKKKKAAAKRR
jgi:hypothetical protein